MSFEAGRDTAAQVLAKLITVDGDGSGLDADCTMGGGDADVLPPGAPAADSLDPGFADGFIFSSVNPSHRPSVCPLLSHFQ